MKKQSKKEEQNKNNPQNKLIDLRNMGPNNLRNSAPGNLRNSRPEGYKIWHLDLRNMAPKMAPKNLQDSEISKPFNFKQRDYYNLSSISLSSISFIMMSKE